MGSKRVVGITFGAERIVFCGDGTLGQYVEQSRFPCIYTCVCVCVCVYLCMYVCV